MDISRKILSDPVNKWLFAQQNGQLYLVGGYMRDLVSGRASKDKDFALYGDAAKLAKHTAKRFKGTFILLKKGLTCRIVLKDKSVIDINYLTEPIEDDLAKRDFTINAIAWNPQIGILDPFNGISDMKKHQIRSINPLNTKADPLRIIRAYRFAAQLVYNITPNTKKELKKYAGGLIYTAPERITNELIKLLNDPKAGKYLQTCINDNVLTRILNIKKDTLSNNIKLVKKFDALSNTLTLSKEIKYLQSIISQDMTRSAIIRLALLIYNKDPQSNPTDKLLKLSSANEIALKRLLNAIHIASSSRISQSVLYRVFTKAGEYSIEAGILIGIIKRSEISSLVSKAEEYIKARKNPLLSGNSIQEILGIGPNRKIGVILARLEEERFKGNITSKSDATSWIISNLT